MPPNLFVLAADDDPSLLPLLRAAPSLASTQDEHGYSLVHAAASYNHLDLLRAVVRELGASVDLLDEDGESALFVVETVEAAKVLVEELGADVTVRGKEEPRLTARQKIEQDDEYPDVAAYLREVEEKKGITTTLPPAVAIAVPTQPPEGVHLTVGTVTDGDEDDVPAEADPEFRRRIEELAQRDDLESAEGQAEMRKLVEDALGAQAAEQGRNVRQRTC